MSMISWPHCHVVVLAGTRMFHNIDNQPLTSGIDLDDGGDVGAFVLCFSQSWERINIHLAKSSQAPIVRCLYSGAPCWHHHQLLFSPISPQHKQPEYSLLLLLPRIGFDIVRLSRGTFQVAILGNASARLLLLALLYCPFNYCSPTSPLYNLPYLTTRFCLTTEIILLWSKQHPLLRNPWHISCQLSIFVNFDCRA